MVRKWTYGQGLIQYRRRMVLWTKDMTAQASGHRPSLKIFFGYFSLVFMVKSWSFNGRREVMLRLWVPFTPFTLSPLHMAPRHTFTLHLSRCFYITEPHAHLGASHIPFTPSIYRHHTIPRTFPYWTI